MYNFMNNGCCPNGSMNNCCNVVNKCFVEEVPHYVNYHTHVVNTCIRRHVNIPTFSTDEEVVYQDEYVAAPPMYNSMCCNMYQQPNIQQEQNNAFDQQPQANTNQMYTNQPQEQFSQPNNVNNPYMF